MGHRHDSHCRIVLLRVRRFGLSMVSESGVKRSRTPFNTGAGALAEEICMPPYVPFAPLTLPPEAAIDLQMHTTFSDGHWTAAQLLDRVTGEGFALVAITDHERLDTIEEVQRLATAHNMLVHPAVEMRSSWDGQMCDILCLGVCQGPSDLATIADSTRSRQAENVHAVYAALVAAGYRFPPAGEILAERGGEPRL